MGLTWEEYQSWSIINFASPSWYTPSVSIPSPGYSHDIAIRDGSNFTYGYMTVPNTAHKGVIDAFRKAIGGSDNPRYQDLSTTKIHAQTDWHKGHGNLLSEDGNFFYNRDTSVRMSNRITVGPQAVQSSASPGMANTLWINSFTNAVGSTQLIRILDDGRVFAKCHGASEAWNIAASIGYKPTSIIIMPFGSPSSDCLVYGRDNQDQYYTQYPGTPSMTQMPGATTFDINTMHRGLLYSGANVPGYQGLYVNSLASPFAGTFVKAIGNNSYKFTGLFSANNALLIGKEDGLWCIPDTDATTITPYKLIDFSTRPHADNFKYMIEHEGNLIVNSSDGELWSINGSLDPTYNRTISAIGPMHKKALPLKMYGDITGLTKSSQYLMTSINAGASGLSGIYLHNGAGWSNFRGPGLDSGENSDGLGKKIVSVSNIIGSPLFSQSRIYWGQDAEVYYSEFIDQEENPNNIKLFNHVISNYVISPPGDGLPEVIMLWDGGLPTVVKWLDKITVFGAVRSSAGLMGGTAGVEVDYQLDPKDIDNLVWTTLSAVSQSSSVRLEDTPSLFPAGVTCKRLAIRLRFLTPSTSIGESPIVEAMTIHYIPRPEQNRAFRYSFDIWPAERQKLLSGIEIVPMEARSNFLFAAHASQVPVYLYRPTGAASPPNVECVRVLISDIDESESIPSKHSGNIHPRGLRTNVTFIEV